jgi:hypothetical protein
MQHIINAQKYFLNVHKLGLAATIPELQARRAVAAELAIS